MNINNTAEDLRGQGMSRQPQAVVGREIRSRGSNLSLLKVALWEVNHQAPFLGQWNVWPSTGMPQLHVHPITILSLALLPTAFSLTLFLRIIIQVDFHYSPESRPGKGEERRWRTEQGRDGLEEHLLNWGKEQQHEEEKEWIELSTEGRHQHRGKGNSYCFAAIAQSRGQRDKPDSTKPTAFFLCCLTLPTFSFPPLDKNEWENYDTRVS